jgi:hypothetical protein
MYKWRIWLIGAAICGSILGYSVAFGQVVALEPNVVYTATADALDANGEVVPFPSTASLSWQESPEILQFIHTGGQNGSVLTFRPLPTLFNTQPVPGTLIARYMNNGVGIDGAIQVEVLATIPPTAIPQPTATVIPTASVIKKIRIRINRQ